MMVKEKLDKRTSRLPHFTVWSLMMVLLFAACGKNNDMPDNSDKAIWISMHIATSERALPTTKSTIIDPNVTPLPDENGKGMENEIRTVRLFVFDMAGNFVANIITDDPENSDKLTTLYFKFIAPKKKYKFVLVANEEMLDNRSRKQLMNFKGTCDRLLEKEFMSVELGEQEVEKSIVAYTSETREFDLSDATKYIDDPNGREYFQVNTEVDPVKIERICAKVELTVTNHDSEGNFLKPESAFFKLKTLRRILIRNTTSLFPMTIEPLKKRKSTELALDDPSKLKGENIVGGKFTFTDQFYAGEYRRGEGFWTEGTLDDGVPGRPSTSYFLQLEDINGIVYDYIIPIGDPIRDSANKLIGMSMERNVIYRINVRITGKHIEVMFFLVAPEREETLDPIKIYPKN